MADPVVEGDDGREGAAAVDASQGDGGSGAQGLVQRRTFLGLGSNLGDRMEHLRQAVAALPDVVAVSPVYETVPVGGPEGQGFYLNMVVELFTSRTPRELLELGQDLEDRAGRVRSEHWGARPLDIDILWVDGVTVDQEDLVVPHPLMWERSFVLVPLYDLAPGLVGEERVIEVGGGLWPAGSL